LSKVGRDMKKLVNTLNDDEESNDEQ